MGLALVDDLAAIDPVLQHQIERAAREWLAAAPATRCARPQPAVDAAGVELVLQQPDRAEFGIAAKNEAHGFRLALDDDQLAVLCPIPERGIVRKTACWIGGVRRRLRHGSDLLSPASFSAGRHPARRVA